MILWRISNYADLKGIGGLQTPGRWHNRGIPVVYLAEHPALALLEVLVHFELDPDETPEGFQLLEVDYPGRSGVAHLQTEALEEGWQQDLELTRAIGDEWLAGGSSVLLRVPSALLPSSYNYLFNPRHPEAKAARIVSVQQRPYDARLMPGTA